MTEILTESFCERCGTRYTFESTRPRARLKGVKVLGRGLKNFVLSDDTSMDEAMAAARSEADRDATAHQLDAFHKTFSFCMSCRQYTCPNCWNEAEARCLSCAPLALAERPAQIDDLRSLRDAVLLSEAELSNGQPEVTATDWPSADQSPFGEEPAEAVAVAADEYVVEEGPAEPVEAEPIEPVAAEPIEPVAAEPIEPIEPVAAEAVGDEAATQPELGTQPVSPGTADKAAHQTTGLLRRFRPGQSLDAELDAYERERSEADLEETVAAELEPVAAAEAFEPERVEAAEIEAPVVAAEERAVAATPLEPSEPAVEPEPEPVAAADIVEQPVWRITAPDTTETGPVPTPTDGDRAVPLQASAARSPAPSAEPQWPSTPEWPAPSSTTTGLPFLGRPATPQGGVEALWAASNQEVVTATPTPARTASGIQPCISCGLSLSANARFCRRCGTLQNR